MSFVYFIGPEAVFHRPDARAVKIGFTKHDPVRRMGALQSGSPVGLELIAYMEGCVGLEQAFHRTFAPLRMHCEWFDLQGKLHDFLWYLYDPPEAMVRRDRVVIAVLDNIFASASSHPSMTDEAYLSTADPRHLNQWFPEVAEQ